MRLASFENDVELYGTQTGIGIHKKQILFENDVELYGTQTAAPVYDVI